VESRFENFLKVERGLVMKKKKTSGRGGGGMEGEYDQSSLYPHI
jgi:hypothetical protein